MKTPSRLFVFLLPTFAIATVQAADTIVHLSPLAQASQPPAQCQIISVQAGSPAAAAGLSVGDIIKQVNGATPADAAAVSDLVKNSPPTMQLVVTSSPTATDRPVTVALRNQHPRLGAGCDLTGWQQPGVTTMGNESMTLFDGPISFTSSGIVDKGLVFLRMRITNNSDRAIPFSSSDFSVMDSTGTMLTAMSPLDVMCFLYGDKGAHLLFEKEKTKDTVDADTAPGDEPEATCPASTTKGKLANSELQFAEANADYVAHESLWPTTCQPGASADGLVYFMQPSDLPIQISATIDGRHFSLSFGSPQPSKDVMKHDELDKFFQAQKKGTPLRLTLRKGRVFVGKFSSYDTVDEKVWFDTPSGRLLNSTSFPLTTVQFAEVIEQVPAKPQPALSEHVN